MAWYDSVVCCVKIVFGVCGDYLGRKKIYLLTLIIIIVGTVGQAMAASTAYGTSVVTPANQEFPRMPRRACVFIHVKVGEVTSLIEPSSSIFWTTSMPQKLVTE